MKKLVVFMLVALFLLGSFPMAFAEEAEAHEHDGCCEGMAEGGIVPLAECRHDDYLPHERNNVYRYVGIGSCRQRMYYDYVCNNCGSTVSSVPTSIYRTVHRGSSELRLAGTDANGKPYYQYYCTYCDELW
ncbi:MAG: hypothetical protein DBX63_03925 [Clostridia bacterium]|nr:MAG: hypothetical protein DBX63_03925 [Clostridia bacterium]